MAIQRISEIEGEPIVGKYYLVPCVYRPLRGWFPIIGPAHNDSEIIGVSGEHRHYDTRFLSDNQIMDLTWGNGLDVESRFVTGAVCWLDDPPQKHAHKRLKCKREPFEFPTHDPKGKLILWMPKLEQAYKDSKLSSCLRCPHRGLPLKGQPIKDGMVVCPGHGLRWNVETGEMVSRL